MKYSQQDIFALLKSYFIEDISKCKNDLNRIIEFNTDLTQIIYDSKMKLEDWEVYIETLLIKAIHTSKSILELSEPKTLKSLKYPDRKIEIIDASSINVLVRSLLEAYLTLTYIYCLNIKKEETKFRFQLWKVSGLISRQKFKFTKKEYLDKQSNEKSIIDELIKELEANKYFHELNKGQLNKLKSYGLPKLVSWNKMIDKSDLNNKLFKDIYSLYSNYAHSEFLSMIQINETPFYTSNQKNIEGIILSLNITRLINCLLIDFIRNKFKIIEIVYHSYPNGLKQNIELLTKFAKKSPISNTWC